jgi:hypothetical protein
MGKYEDPDMVSASAIASWGYCPEAWRLGCALGMKPTNERELSRGEMTHENFSAVEKSSQGAMRLGLALILLGALLVGIFRFVGGR